ncbi:MAG: ABC transporter ATP-binding protein [Pseudomonadota bacterium]
MTIPSSDPSSGNNSAITIDDVRLTLPSQSAPVEILKGISLDIISGTTVGIVGPSGSGKTSLLMVMAGLERATSGSVLIAGQDLQVADEATLAELRLRDIGIVFQSFHLVPTMTALENVALPLEFAGDPAAFARAERALDDVGLTHRLGHFPAQLSGGEQQRVALARAVVHRPRILLADEPTGNLDAASGKLVVEQLFALSADAGVTLVLITHDAGLAARCERVVEIGDGCIVGDRMAAVSPAALEVAS